MPCNLDQFTSYFTATGDLKAMIEREFGSVQAMQDQLSAMSIAVQGSGWGWLVRQLNGVLYVEYNSMHLRTF